jgi:hypothetical protein
VKGGQQGQGRKKVTRLGVIVWEGSAVRGIQRIAFGRDKRVEIDVVQLQARANVLLEVAAAVSKESPLA